MIECRELAYQTMDIDRSPTLQDVARLAGVHPSTASRSLDPLQSDRIGAATRERVLAVARELNYVPHVAAGSLRTRRSRTVGVLVPDLGNPVYAAFLAGIGGRLERDGYTAIVLETRNDHDRLVKALRILDERRVEGAINAAARANDQRQLAQFVRKGTPMVLAARDVPGLKVPRVLNDDWKGGALAAEHLLSLGHRRIAQITGPADIASFLERARGFRSAVRDADGRLEVHDDAATIGSVEEGRRVMQAVLRRLERPTAVFTHNDLLAIGAIAAIREAGLDCPGDVSVVGYDDTPLTEYLCPPLTTVLFPAQQLGHVAAGTVLSMLRGTEPRSALSLQPQLIVRQSTAKAPTSKQGRG